MSHTPQQARSRETRRKLLDSAISTLSHHGAADTTVSAVAVGAGVSRGAAQRHFPTRDVLIEETVAEFYSRLTHQLRRAVADLGTPPGGSPTVEVMELVFDSFTSDSFRAALHVWSAAAGSEGDLRELIVSVDSRYAREVQQLMAIALDADLLDPPTRELLRMTVDLARGLGLGAVLVDNSDQRRRTVDRWSSILDAGLARNN
ncbi:MULTISPECIES: TetR/AcrR family transcriptional regulator [unclassified Corynebacterium]|uniref:TetR/AcrR family transcriptional regulator n=1 Tax=unclassified Corynebacterium TaxID=2624378 RepID=UPI002656BDEF|nr:TetR/AcrR family transcriptional regulator [Corynebacterium sp.]MDN6324536.1 TetR/AcrR family transcriptional regulator [Corynebacterium sp.]MDN6386345.1 TetR/AcrR family transcriptional regulator [Corynebacterium sp.]